MRETIVEGLGGVTARSDKAVNKNGGRALSVRERQRWFILHR